jgi:hypothetical protein
MLQVDDTHSPPARKNGHGKECLVTVLRELGKEPEAGVPGSVAGNRHRLPMLGHPPGDPLSDPQFEAVQDLRMRILRRPQHEFPLFQNVNEAGIALDESGDEADDAVENFVERPGSGKAAADFVKHVDFRIVVGQGRTTHASVYCLPNKPSN